MVASCLSVPMFSCGDAGLSILGGESLVFGSRLLPTKMILAHTTHLECDFFILNSYNILMFDCFPLYMCGPYLKVVLLS